MACTTKDEFVEYNTDGIRQYYLRENKGQRAHCKACSLVKCEGGSTSGLHTHQRTKHGADLLKRPACDTSTKKSMNDDQSADGIKRKSAPGGTADGPVTKYLLDTNERSLAATIARMTARFCLFNSQNTSMHYTLQKPISCRCPV